MLDFESAFVNDDNDNDALELSLDGIPRDAKLVYLCNTFAYRKYFKHLYFSDSEIKKMGEKMFKLSDLNTDVYALPFYYADQYFPYIDMDFYVAGDLQHVLKNQKMHKLTETEKIKIAYGIAKGISLLNENNISHDHISINDVLIDENYEPHLNGLVFRKINHENSVSDDIEDILIIFSALDDKCFASLMNIAHTNYMQSVEDVCSYIVELASNGQNIDFNIFVEYKDSFISNKESVFHGSPKQIGVALNNNISMAIDVLASAATKTEVVHPKYVGMIAKEIEKKRNMLKAVE